MAKLGDRSRAVGNVPEVPTLSEARSGVTALDGPINDLSGATGIADEYEFDLDYYDERRKRRWTGRFKTHVLSGMETIQLGLVMARLRGNSPPHALDTMTLQLTEMYGYLTISLLEAPKWARGDALMAIRDIGVLGAIYKEARDHEARFWGADGGDSDEGDDGESEVAHGDHVPGDDRPTSQAR